MTESRQSYIDQYAEYAMEQMRRYGIPASVTLAQGIIESADGKSMLARNANNHFGVKGEFNGQYMRADDDKPNEKFKKYDNVGQSYEDHSKVLMADRYQKYTKGLSPDDYKGWAAGIKAGGYATGKNYVNTIVGVIEGANLQKYDQMVMQEMRAQGKSFGTAQNPLTVGASRGDSNANAIQTAKSASGTKYSFPLKRDEFMLVTSPFGMRNDPINKGQKQFHKGFDLQTKHEAVLATEDNGKVVMVNQNVNTGGGKSVTVEYNRQDGSKYQTTYMHLDSIDVKVGDTVNAGQKLGISGNTGTRTTGEHLHFQVKTFAADGTARDIDPAAYLAEIAHKGNIQVQTLHNGKDLIAQYKVEGGQGVGTDNSNILDSSISPADWMKKLLSSEDSGVGLGNSADPIIDMAVTMFTTLMALAVQIDNKSEEDKMQAATEAAVNKSFDLTSLLPYLKECNIMLNNGKPLLQVNNGMVSFTHEFTNAELTRIQQTLGNANLSDAEKQRTIASVINGIVVSQQMSHNYQQCTEAQQSQQEAIQRK